MGGIKELATVFCAVCLLTGGIGLLSGGVLKKSVGYILSLILLLSVVTALTRTDINFKPQKEAKSAVSGDYEESMSEYQAEYISKKLLTESGITYDKVSAKATKNEDGGIIINEITIRGANRKEDAVRIVTESGLTDRVKTE